MQKSHVKNKKFLQVKINTCVCEKVKKQVTSRIIMNFSAQNVSLTHTLHAICPSSSSLLLLWNILMKKEQSKFRRLFLWQILQWRVNDPAFESAFITNFWEICFWRRSQSQSQSQSKKYLQKVFWDSALTLSWF